MKTITTAIAAALFATGINAQEVYHGLARGNPDLYDEKLSFEPVAGVQPGIGDSFDIYRGLADGNSDLFRTDRSGPTDSGDDPDIYHGVAGNPDLQF